MFSIFIRFAGLFILVYLLFNVKIDDIWATLLKLELSTILIILTSYLILILLKSIRWVAIARIFNISLPLWNAYLAYWSSILLGFITPGRLGEFGKMFYVKDRSSSKFRQLLSVILDRLFDFVFIFLTGAASFVYFFTPEFLWYFIAGIIILIVVVSLLWFNPLDWKVLAKFKLGMRKRIAVFGRDKSNWLDNPQDWAANSRWASWILALCLTFLAYCFYFSLCFILSLSLGLNLKFLVVVTAVSLGGLAALLPISFAGLGTRESAIVFVFSAFGVETTEALSYSLVIFMIFYVFGAIIGAIAWFLQPLQIKQLDSSIEEAGQ